MGELYIGEENCRANQHDYKRALDLLEFLEEDAEDVEELRLHIWCRCILMDQWSDLDTDNWLSSCQETQFFTTVDLIHSQGGEIFSYLPAQEELLSADELGMLRDDTTFQFLLSAGYEHLQAIQI